MRLEDIPLVLKEVDLPKERFKDVINIPEGRYCYESIRAPSRDNGWKYEIKSCPYHRSISDRGNLENGYCLFLGLGDKEMGLSLLWDSVKECGQNENG